MSTHKQFDRICVVITLLALLITILFMNGEALGLTASARSMGYEQTLFDTSRVHTIDIVIDDWDAFIQTATSEEYAACSVVIDNEAVKNVAIRGKGNTSLSSVATMGSERYSLKLEFDHYEASKTWKGLDKLCLNNLIQDNTYMKDYLAYRLMAEFGADAPLSVSGDVSRPLVDWIFQNEEYTALYHQYFAEFLDSVDIEAIIDEAYSLIAPYVGKDPTAFCSYEEFETGVETLRSFCEKRTESVRGQLDGTIPSTDAGQQADSSELIDASALALSSMGSMSSGGGPGGNFFGEGQRVQSFPGQGAGSGGSGKTPGRPDAVPEAGAEEKPSAPVGFDFGERQDTPFPSESSSKAVSLPTLLLSAVVLIGGLLTAFLYKRK